MMKKFVSAIISAFIVAAIVFSFAGCEKFKEVVPSETLATVAEFRMGYVDSIPDDTLLETWASDEYRYKKIISDDFAMGAEGADNFYANPADHIVYGVTVEVVNNTSLPIEVTGIESEMNGSNGVYFRKNFDGGERLVSAKSSEAITLHVLCSNLNISDDEVIETLKSMYFTLVYTQNGTQHKYELPLENSVEVAKDPNAVETAIRIGDGGFDFSQPLWDAYKVDNEANRAALKNNFGVSDDFIKAFYAKSEDYNFFNYPVLVENMSGHDIVIFDVSVEGNGNGGIYLNVAFNGEMGIPAKDPNANYMLPSFIVQVLCDNDDLSDEQVKSVVDAMSFTITYAEKAVDGDADSEETKEKQTITVTIA